jgi:hypothetical protein
VENHAIEQKGPVPVTFATSFFYTWLIMTTVVQNQKKNIQSYLVSWEISKFCVGFDH